jgi:hypothetical protein
MAAPLGVDAGLLGAPADHAPDIGAVHRQVGPPYPVFILDNRFSR